MKIAEYDYEVQTLNRELLTARSSMSGSYINICNRLLRKAKSVDDTNLLGYAYYYLADAYYQLSTNYSRFHTNLIKAIEYLQKCGDFEHLARCYNLLGIDALNHGNREFALDFFMSALKYCEGMEESSVPGLIKFNVGQIYYKNGEIREALLYIRSAYRDIRKNKGDSLYYRNMLYCYCFEADCYMQLGKKESVARCLKGIDKVESDPAAAREFFLDIPILDTRMRANYYLGNMDVYEVYSHKLSNMIQTNKYPLDSMEDIFVICRFFVEIGRLDEVALIVKNTERSLYDLNIPNLILEHSQLKVKLYELLGDSDSRSKALEEFYIHSMVLKKERESSYKFFTTMRKKLSEMEKENSMLLKRAETDSLTGLGNRYALNRFADKAFENAYFTRQPLAVEILDVDNFKRYNDTYGHQAGDECLKKIGNEISKICTNSDNVHGFRYGGDEFVIIYENLTDEQVMDYALSLRSQVTSMKIESNFSNQEGFLSISQGIRNSVPLETNKLWDYMYAADNALYDVKDHKKGEIVLLHKAKISKTSLDEARHS
jgi:diguanylate cyclase (GGDEF)-like protein